MRAARSQGPGAGLPGKRACAIDHLAAASALALSYICATFLPPDDGPCSPRCSLIALARSGSAAALMRLFRAGVQETRVWFGLGGGSDGCTRVALGFLRILRMGIGWSGFFNLYGGWPFARGVYVVEDVCDRAALYMKRETSAVRFALFID